MATHGNAWWLWEWIIKGYEVQLITKRYSIMLRDRKTPLVRFIRVPPKPAKVKGD